MRGQSRYIFTLVLVTCALRLGAQNIQHVELSFNMDHFRLVSSDEGHYVVESDEGDYYYPEDSGLPALPVRNVNILVPNGAELEDFNYSTKEEIIQENIILSTADTPVPLSLLEINQTVDSERVRFEGDFPLEALEFSATHIQRGYTWFSFTFSPFKYNGKNQELSQVRELILDVEYRINKDHAPIIRPDKAVLHNLKCSVVNPEDLDSFYPAGDLSILKSTKDRLDYLIITTEELKPGFEPLLLWKFRKGLMAEVITLEEISSEYDEPNIQMKIKRCLYDYYNHRNLKWVLLGGDNDVVPVQGCYSRLNIDGREFIDESVPTDLYYACFDNRFDWNGKEDEKIGELIWDQNDVIPEILISRIPVHNLEQIRTFVEKSLTYELNPPRTEFTELMLLTGVKSWSSWNGMSDNHHRSEFMFNNYIKKNWSGRKVSFFDTGTDFNGDQEYQVTSTNLTAQLNKGYGFFHFAGHGNKNTFRMESGNDFNTSDALALTNPFPGIMLSNACYVNAFDFTDPCLSESFLRNSKGGAVAFFGSSRLGFGNSYQSDHLGPSFHYNARFLKILFDTAAKIQRNSFAEIAAMTKSSFANFGSSGGTYLYLLYAINAMGDPELPIYTRDPSTFDNVRLYRIGNKWTVNTGGIKDCRICITSQDLREGYQKVVEDVSYYTFEDIPEPFQVTITGLNYIPYQYKSESITGMDNSLRSRVSFYPNPANEYLYIDIDNDIPMLRLQLFDMQGRLLVEQEAFPGSCRVDLSGFTDGPYLLKFMSNEGIACFRFLKRSA